MTTTRTQTRPSATNRADRFNEETPCSLVRLAMGSAWTPPRHVREIKCISGRIWLTKFNDSRDYVLVPGQSMANDGKGVVVQAIEDAVMRV
jgi:hypothetical protein